MILSDRTIREELDTGRIVIDPLGEGCIQPSSVDLHVDRFFRVSGQSEPGRADGGSGIGLSLVARIAQIHDARIEPCDGIEGRGFCIAVFFPCAPEPAV